MELIKFSSIFFTFTLLLISLKLLQRKLNKPRDESTPKLPPGPWKLPIIGSIHHLAFSGLLPHRALAKLSRKHGEIMHLQLGEISLVVISGPRSAREALKAHDAALAGRPKAESVEIVFYNRRGIALTPYSEYWRKMRQICALELFSARRVRSFASIREDEVWNMISSIQSSSSSGKIDLTGKIFALTNGVTCRATIGSRCKYQDEIIKLASTIMEICSGFDVADFFPSRKFLRVFSRSIFKVKKVIQRVDQILDEIIQEHREKMEISGSGNEEDDLVDVLLKINENGHLNFPIETKNIKAIINEMFMAGTDTSASTIIWAMAEMMRNPRVLETAQEEVRGIINGKKSRISESDLEGLSYLKLVIKETLRLHPPVPMLLPRECMESCEIEGYEIPVGTRVFVNAWAINRDPEFWEDAESFKPERFLENEIDVIGTNFEYIPFGGGRRMCPGIAFGSSMMELALAQLLYHFDWQIPGGIKPELLDMTEMFGASIKRKNPLCLDATVRFPFQ